MNLLVLVEQRVWDEFRPAVEAIGERWTASSGRTYALTLDERRLDVHLEQPDLAPPPAGDEIDADLFELAGQIYDAVGGDWSADALRRTSEAWGYVP